MPGSGAPEVGGDGRPGGASSEAEGSRSGDPSPESALDGLEKAVGRLLDEFDGLRRRAGEAEESYRSLTEALRSSGSGSIDPAEAAERLQRLAEENERLRSVIDEARERAERIRSRLTMVEDEL